MKQFIFLCLGLVALMGTATQAVAPTCLTCSSTNNAACINATAFKFCFDGTTPSEIIGVCAEGEVCMNDAAVCEPKTDTLAPNCGGSSASCSEPCSAATDKFACVSKTQFVACKDSKVTTDPIACDAKKVCNINQLTPKGTVCVSTCEFEPSCTSDTPSKPNPTDPINYGKTCDTALANGLYLNVADATCKTYVYCEMVGTTWQSILYKCTTGYYDKTTKKCVTTKPTGCKDS